MKRQELQITLNELNVPELWYSLDGEAMPNKTILQKGGGIKGSWIIYDIDERGIKSKPKEFYSEDEACEYFYQIIKKYKERTDRINKMPLLAPLPTEKQHTYIVSETGEIKIQKEKN